MKHLAVTAAALFVSGCAAMADLGDQIANLGQVSVEQSAFDGSTTVALSPTWMAPAEETGLLTPSLQMGAKWHSDLPDRALLIFAHPSSTSGGNAFTTFTLVEINVDGEIRSFEPGRTKYDSGTYNTVSRNIYTDSSAAIVVPYDYLKRMISANRTLLRISTSDGYVETNFTEPTRYGGATTITRMPAFIERVDGFIQMQKNAEFGRPVSAQN